MMRRFESFIMTMGAVILFVLFLFTGQGLHAQEADVSNPEKKIIQLENAIKLLEARLEECRKEKEARIHAAPGWQNKKNWRQLELGMQESQVRSILGEPTKVIQGTITLWYYPNTYGGYVSFDKGGKLAGWNEP